MSASRAKKRATPQPSSPKPLAVTAKSAHKRSQIIRVATEIINQRGFALATMNEIAAMLGLRDASLYYYYPNKHALAFACHIDSLERFEALLNQAKAAGGDGHDKLRSFVRALLTDAEAHGPQLYFGDYSYLEEAQRLAVASWWRRLEIVLEGFLREGVADGSLVSCDIRLVVQLLLGMLVSLAKWVPSIEDITVERLMEAISVASLNGLAARRIARNPT